MQNLTFDEFKPFICATVEVLVLREINVRKPDKELMVMEEFFKLYPNLLELYLVSFSVMVKRNRQVLDVPTAPGSVLPCP